MEKRNRNIIILLIIANVVSISFLIYLLIVKQIIFAPEKPVHNLPTTAEDEKEASEEEVKELGETFTPEQVIGRLVVLANDTLKEKLFETTKIPETSDSVGVYVKPDGLNVYTEADGYSTGYVELENENYDALVSMFDKEITGLDFAFVNSLPYDIMLSISKGKTSTYFNEKNNIFCIVKSYQYVTVACGYNKFSGSEVDKRLINGLANALPNEYYDGINLYISANEKDIKNSEYAPYQTIQLGYTSVNAVLRFYRTSSDSEWKFFTASQALEECSDYNTEDLKRAYLGVVCQDANGERSTVSL